MCLAYFVKTFDESDPEKDKGLLMACCSVCEEWLHQKRVERKREVFLDKKVHKRWKCHSFCTN